MAISDLTKRLESFADVPSAMEATSPTMGKYLTSHELQAIVLRDLLSSGPREHDGKRAGESIACHLADEATPCSVCAADDAAPDDRTALLSYVEALRTELSQCQKERTDC